MDSTTIFIAVIGLVIYIFIIYQVIFNASYGRAIWRENWKQTRILSEIALLSGVNAEKLSQILQDENYRPPKEKKK